MNEVQTIETTAERSGSRLLTGTWEHIFLEDGRERTRECRIVYDLDREEVTWMDVKIDHKWRASERAQREDLTDSIRNANSECLEDPEAWDLEAVDSLPEWAR